MKDEEWESIFNFSTFRQPKNNIVCYILLQQIWILLFMFCLLGGSNFLRFIAPWPHQSMRKLYTWIMGTKLLVFKNNDPKHYEKWKIIWWFVFFLALHFICCTKKLVLLFWYASNLSENIVYIWLLHILVCYQLLKDLVSTIHWMLHRLLLKLSYKQICG